MTFVVDIGNSNIVCAVYQAGVLLWQCRLKADNSVTSDEYYAFLISLKGSLWHPSQISFVVIASVVPSLLRLWIDLFRKFFSARLHILTGNSELGLSYLVKDPSFLGADLVANALSAWHKYSSSCLIVDCGTATTIQLVSSKGIFMGAIIAPGVITASQNLFNRAALLKEMELSSPQVILGTNTLDALLSGIVYGHAFMIDGFITRLKREFSALGPILSIATGGLADLICKDISSLDLIDKTLTIDGLMYASNIIFSSSHRCGLSSGWSRKI